jgi:hypothetical protein
VYVHEVDPVLALLKQVFTVSSANVVSVDTVFAEVSVTVFTVFVGLVKVLMHVVTLPSVVQVGPCAGGATVVVGAAVVDEVVQVPTYPESIEQ